MTKDWIKETKVYHDRTSEGVNFLNKLTGHWKLVEQRGGGNYGSNDVYMFIDDAGHMYQVVEFGDGSMSKTLKTKIYKDDK